MHLEYSVENGEKTLVELNHSYETSELKPFLHQQWIYKKMKKMSEAKLRRKKLKVP